MFLQANISDMVLFGNTGIVIVHNVYESCTVGMHSVNDS